MTFKDLPRGVKDLPLTDATLQADVIDLVIGDEARASGCIGVMLCDSQDRGIQPVVVSDVPNEADSAGLRQFLDLVLPVLADESGSVLVGRGRGGARRATDSDRQWHQCAIDSCARHGVRLLGFYLATPAGVDQLPGPLSVAS